mmetsp:Transcript_26550/g.88021  ORF Transcript_26550/g.88021 Transcript_26550/m.88021 type:complete len:698 (+) Transcript_26550:37-2130(+)
MGDAYSSSAMSSGGDYLDCESAGDGIPNHELGGQVSSKGPSVGPWPGSSDDTSTSVLVSITDGNGRASSFTCSEELMERSSSSSSAPTSPAGAPQTQLVGRSKARWRAQAMREARPVEPFDEQATTCNSASIGTAMTPRDCALSVVSPTTTTKAVQKLAETFERQIRENQHSNSPQKLRPSVGTPAPTPRVVPPFSLRAIDTQELLKAVKSLREEHTSEFARVEQFHEDQGAAIEQLRSALPTQRSEAEAILKAMTALQDQLVCSQRQTDDDSIINVVKELQDQQTAELITSSKQHHGEQHRVLEKLQQHVLSQRSSDDLALETLNDLEEKLMQSSQLANERVLKIVCELKDQQTAEIGTRSERQQEEHRQQFEELKELHTKLRQSEGERLVKVVHELKDQQTAALVTSCERQHDEHMKIVQELQSMLQTQENCVEQKMRQQHEFINIFGQQTVELAARSEQQTADLALRTAQQHEEQRQLLEQLRHQIHTQKLCEELRLDLSECRRREAMHEVTVSSLHEETARLQAQVQRLSRSAEIQEEEKAQQEKGGWASVPNSAREHAARVLSNARRTLVSATETTRAKTVEIAANKKVQVTAASAVGGAATVGVGGGATGLLAGGLAGAAAGVIPAIFTFGLSIPLFAAVGGACGLAVGTAAGGVAGLVGGGAAGYEVYNRVSKGERASKCPEDSACGGSD